MDNLRHCKLFKDILSKLFSKTRIFSKPYSSNQINKKGEIVYVNPMEIKNYTVCRFPKSIYKKRGQIYGGFWDYLTIPFISRPAAKGVNEHFNQNIPWEKTSYFNLRLRGKYGDAKTETETKKYLRDIDLLYESIQKNGFQEGYEGWNWNNFNNTEIGVAISRKGEILWLQEGQHRLSIAKSLKLEKIPVVVVLWHKNFIENTIKQTGLESFTPKALMKERSGDL